MCRLKSTEGARRAAHAGSLLANLEAVVILGLGTLEPNIVGYRLVGHISTAAHEVAAPPQVPTPERRPQPPIILEEMMGGLALDRVRDTARVGGGWGTDEQEDMGGLALDPCHDTARREVGGGTQQQVDMVWPHVPLDYFDILIPSDFPDQKS